MAKFSKGDKVESVKTGAKGVVDEVYGEEKYAVLFDGAANPDRVEGHQIKAAPVSTNSVVRNAMAANRSVARNADKLDKRFGNVRVLAYEDGGLGVRYVIDIGGIVEFANAVSWNDAGKKCAEDARHTASLFEKRASLLRQAATWLEQNAK
jgi:hypothetical protein